MIAPDAESPAVICILGMHRSGTSCLAGSLEEAGLYLGDVYVTAPHNAKGNRESRAIMDLQEEILRDSGGSWDRPPSVVFWTEKQRSRRDEIIEGYPEDKTWGFKDPRTLLTIDGWLDALPRCTTFVGTFRHPSTVAASLRRRNGFAQDKSNQLWVAYNRLLLSMHRRYDIPIVCFDWDRDRYTERLASLCDSLDLTVPVGGFTFPERGLTHHFVEPDYHLPLEMAKMLEELMEIAASK